jgi:hypothetical protein
MRYEASLFHDHIGHMTGGTDQDHLAVLEFVVRGLAHCLPPGPVVQYDCFTQVVHREYVLMGIEKHVLSMIGMVMM